MVRRGNTWRSLYQRPVLLALAVFALTLLAMFGEPRQFFDGGEPHTADLDGFQTLIDPPIHRCRAELTTSAGTGNFVRDLADGK